MWCFNCKLRASIGTENAMCNIKSLLHDIDSVSQLNQPVLLKLLTLTKLLTKLS